MFSEVNSQKLLSLAIKHNEKKVIKKPYEEIVTMITILASMEARWHIGMLSTSHAVGRQFKPRQGRVSSCASLDHW